MPDRRAPGTDGPAIDDRVDDESVGLRRSRPFGITMAMQAVGSYATNGGAALRVRNFRLFWIGQIISRTGTWMQQVSLPWLVITLGGTPTQLGLVAALEFAPSLILAPVGGVYADRWDKRRAIFITQLIAAIQVVVLLLITLSGGITIELIMLLSLGLGLVNAVDTPLRQSFAADLVPRDILPNAIALNSIAYNGSRVIGPAVAGVTIAAGITMLGSVTSGVALNVAINALTFVAALVAITRMDPQAIHQEQRDVDTRVLSSLREGFTYAMDRSLVRWSLVLLALVACMALNFRILLPLFTQDVLHLGPATYGGLYAALGLGALAGAMTMAVLRDRNVVRLMTLGAIGVGLSLVGLTLSPPAVPAAALLVGAGFSQMVLMNTVNAAIQMNVADRLRGRVVALYVTVVQGSTPIGAIIAGALVEYGSVPIAFAVGAVSSILAAAFVWIKLRAHRMR